MTPAQHAREIVAKAASDIAAKYEVGQREHNTRLWHGGAGWVARAAREEAVDLMAYTHCLIDRLTLARRIVGCLRDEATTDDAVYLIDCLDAALGDGPPPGIDPA